MDIENAVLVVAHPDDEVLWFSSILDNCKSVLVCFGPSLTSAENCDSGRKLVMDNYPLSKAKFLKIGVAGVLNAANWKNPRQTSSGLDLSRHASTAYQRNSEDLLRILEAELKSHDVVVTHNPWGEYGHEEHVQVFRVLSRLKESLGFELFVNTYVSNKSAILMAQTQRFLAGEPAVHSTNRAIAQSLKDLYLRNDCWTFDTDFEWPTYETFYSISNGRDTDHSTYAPSTSLLVNYLTRSRGQPAGFLKVIAQKALPMRIKSKIKKQVDARWGPAR